LKMFSNISPSGRDTDGKSRHSCCSVMGLKYAIQP
jgi:hypothetical protein